MSQSEPRRHNQGTDKNRWMRCKVEIQIPIAIRTNEEDCDEIDEEREEAMTAKEAPLIRRVGKVSLASPPLQIKRY
jgi:hypothetical protein